jgi:CheY-like chemotaxis protein
MNLVSNAVKYNRPGGRVLVRALHSPAGQDPATVIIEVEDTGAGLSTTQMAQLFQPFNRLGAEATAIQGTGIGLVISRGLVERMHGRLEVQSQVGQGSKFTVTLPAADGAMGSPALTTLAVLAPAPAPAAPDGEAKSSSTDLKVLYVEDHPVNVALVVAMCERRAGVVLSLAGSGAEALERVSAERPDLMLVDMNLGDMTGLELRQALLAQDLLHGVRMVALSADAMPAHIEAAREAGFDAYLTKPLRLRELLAAFDEARQGRVAP